MSKLYGTCKCSKVIEIDAPLQEFTYTCECGIKYDYYFNAKLDKTVLEII